MATITKKEVVKTIADKTGLTDQDCLRTLQVFMDLVIEHLAQRDRLEFREFGVWETKQRRPRMGRNPKTGEQVQVKSRRVVSFKPGRLMKASVNGDDADGSDG